MHLSTTFLFTVYPDFFNEQNINYFAYYKHGLPGWKNVTASVRETSVSLEPKLRAPLKPLNMIVL